MIFAHVIALNPVLMFGNSGPRRPPAARTPCWPPRRRACAGRPGTWRSPAWARAALLAVAGLVFGVVFSLLVGEPASDVSRILAGALGTTPAAWLVGAVCVLAYGLVPRASVAISWATWVATAAPGQSRRPAVRAVGRDPFEPFHYIPNTVAGAPLDPAPSLVMLALSALLLGGGLSALRRRDFG